MLRTALLLALLSLALAGKLPAKQDGGKDCDEGDLPSSIASDEDVRRIFRFLVSNGRKFSEDVRKEIPQADDIRKAQDPDAALGEVLQGVGKAFRSGMQSQGKVLHALGMLSEAIFTHQLAFKRLPGGCSTLYSLSQSPTFNISDKTEAAREAAVALSDDLYCMAGDADMAQAMEASIDYFQSGAMTALDALTIVGGIAHGIIKSNEDGVKVFDGALKVLTKIDPAMAGQLHAALSDQPSHEQEVARLLRTLLKEIDHRK